MAARRKTPKTAHSDTIFSVSKRLKGKSGNRLQSSRRTGVTVSGPDIVYSMNMKAILEDLTYVYVEHCVNSLLAGKHPTGRRKLPELDEATTEVWSPDRVGAFWNRTSTTIRRWLFEGIKGSTVKASRITRPSGGEYPKTLDVMLRKHGYDFLQGINGDVEKILINRLKRWQKAIVGTPDAIVDAKPGFTGGGNFDSIAKPPKHKI